MNTPVFVLVVWLIVGISLTNQQVSATEDDICPGQVNVCAVLEYLLNKNQVTITLIKALQYDLEMNFEPYNCIMDPINNAVCAPPCHVRDSLKNFNLKPNLVNDTMTKILKSEPKCATESEIDNNDNPYRIDKQENEI
ncbi:uncharacterized protein LOC113374992 [Ctenocephalides felis]|uniref:uncharacterized protein LOC113374992 n=1 Tax=Ctenocephalides felis TaxID=7515 RepID=UPI000E6E5505|nr:uncharacterized protein LOC113374992 [Ctenocephalides felis]